MKLKNYKFKKEKKNKQLNPYENLKPELISKIHNQ
jgi:hypothetical protein